MFQDGSLPPTLLAAIYAMPQHTTFQHLFQRERRRGDLVFAIVFMAFSIFLLSQIGNETAWVKSSKWFKQPALWSAISLGLMVFFAVLHFLGSIMSARIVGRLQEVGFWLRSLEYAAWFLIYVWVVPIVGYLPTTLVFLPLLALRLGYRSKRMLLIAMAIGFAIVLLFKTFLAVKIPGGELYEHLPKSVRSFMLINF